MNKKELIIDALQELVKEDKGGIASVSDIAKKAGIAKGGMYYYFRSKEEVLDALIIREYADIIQQCDILIKQSQGSAIKKLALLLQTYRSFSVDSMLDAYLHMPQNAALHQKSLAQILVSLSPIVSTIITQGIMDGEFTCEHPLEYAEIIVSVFSFLLDPGIFPWSKEQYYKKLKALAEIVEKGLCTSKGSFSFLYQQN